jgi:Tfp pilus tip-associated adhesin PilY1
MIYVGSRDGMLHAFDGGNFRWGYYDNDTFKWGDNPKTTAIKEYRGYFKWSGDTSATADYGTGIEKWAYIPANLISRLKNNLMSAEDQAYVDASPAISDVYINNAWTTVLLSAEGNGGDTVYCLDVTDPLSPKFLWEFADPDLYRSRSSPAVGVIGRIAPGKWAAFFVSGITYDNTLYPSVYLIDIENGSVIQRIFLGAEPNSIQGVPNSVPAGIGGVPSGQPAVVDSDGDGFLDRMYIGTDKGYLYKVNIPNDHSDLSGYTQSVINTDLGGLDRHPIHASPVVVVQNTYNHEKLETKVKILFGTGDSPYFNDYTTGTKYHFFSYVDTVPAPQCKVCTSTGIASLDWFYELPVGERIFASAFAAAGSIYFGTSTAETEDPCEGSGKPTANSGRLYVMKIATGELVTPEPISTGNITTAPVVDDEHLYVKIPTGTIATKGPYNNALPGEPLSSISSWREIFNKDVSLTPTVTATPSL